MSDSTSIEAAEAWIGTDGWPRYATAQDFDTVWDSEHTFPFFEDEDAAGVYGFGHIDKATFAAQVNQCDVLAMGESLASGIGYTESDVIHCWAVLTSPREDDGVRFSWRGVDSRTLGSWPLTRIVR